MEYIRFVDKDGKTRKGEYRNCQYCQQKFLTRIDRSIRYCSHECNRADRKCGVFIKCAWCQKEFYKKSCQLRNSKSGLYFCRRKCKDEAQRLGGIQQIMPSHYGTRTSPICIDDFNTVERKCACGESRYYLMCVHHIDGNRNNNAESNIEIVCYNCHALRHMEQTLGIWHLNYKQLTPRDRLKEL